MKIKVLALALTVFALAIASPAAHAQTAITVLNSPCGNTGGNNQGQFNCNTVNLTVGGVSGTAWFDPQSPTSGFIVFRSPLEGGINYQIQITQVVVTSRDSLGNVTGETISFSGLADPDVNGDSDTIQGSVSITMVHHGTGKFHTMTITGGSGSQQITQD